MLQTRTTMPLQAATIAGLLLLGGVAFAQDTSSMDKKAGVQNLREKAQMLKTEVKEKDIKKTRTDGVVRKLEAHLKNLEELLARTESRIAKLAAQNTDTTKSAAFVATAKMKIAEAKVAIEEVRTKAQAITDTATRESITAVTLAARNAEAKVKVARAALTDAISSLKPGRNTVKPRQ